MQIGLPTMLFLIFLVLKLTEVIAWSWWWVTAPLWVPLAFVGVLWLMVFVIAGVTKSIRMRRSAKLRKKMGIS